MLQRLMISAFVPLVVAGLLTAYLAAPGQGRRQSEPSNLVRLREAYLDDVTHRGLIARYERDGAYSGTLWVGQAWADASQKEAVCFQVHQALFPDTEDRWSCRLALIDPDGTILGHFQPRRLPHEG